MKRSLEAAGFGSLAAGAVLARRYLRAIWHACEAGFLDTP